MSLRLGFVGVGRWARKLADSFRACGAEIVAHDRANRQFVCDGNGVRVGELEPAGFGAYVTAEEQIRSKHIDAIIAVAPPDVTTEVALACAAAGKPVMATKPLWNHPERITAPFYVDFWRLWSYAQSARRAGVIQFIGSGPTRAFSGLDDYGPHVMAAILDLGFPLRLVTAGTRPANGQEATAATFEAGDKGEIHVVFGNLATEAAPAGRNWWGHAEDGEHIGSELKANVLRRFCQSFLNDVSEGYADTRLLNLSRDGMALLKRIREESK